MNTKELYVYCGDNSRHNGRVPGFIIGGRFTQFSPQFSYDSLAPANWRTGRLKTDKPLLPQWNSKLHWLTDSEDYWHMEGEFARWYRDALLETVRFVPDDRFQGWGHLFLSGNTYSESYILSVAKKEVFRRFAENFKKIGDEGQRLIFERFTDGIIVDDTLEVQHRAMLVARVTDSDGAARWLAFASNLTPNERAMLVARVIYAGDAALVLSSANSNLTPDQRAMLVARVTNSNTAAWVLAKAANLPAAERATLERVAAGKFAVY